MKRIYLDYNATTPVLPEVCEAVGQSLCDVGNPSSIHDEGRRAKVKLRKARQQVAQLMGCQSDQVIFTASGTEASLLALSPVLCAGGKQDKKKSRLLVGATEHASVLRGGRFAPDQVSQIPVSSDGLVLAGQLEEYFQKIGLRPYSDTEKNGKTWPFMVSLMYANNETGVVQDIEQLGKIVHEYGGLFHVDGVQAAGKLALNFSALPIDYMSVSAHKLGGMQGVGALIARDGDSLLQDVLMKGGGQEKNRRGGTENLPGIISFGLACEMAAGRLDKEKDRLASLRDRLEDGLARINKRVEIVGLAGERLPNTCCFLSPGMKAETMLMGFDLAGIAASSGSACSSGTVKASHVLGAMGYTEEEALGAIRVSLGWQSCGQDIEAFLSVYADMVNLHSRQEARA